MPKFLFFLRSAPPAVWCVSEVILRHFRPSLSLQRVVQGGPLLWTFTVPLYKDRDMSEVISGTRARNTVGSRKKLPSSIYAVAERTHPLKEMRINHRIWTALEMVFLSCS